MRSVRVIAAVSVLLCAAVPAARADVPNATVSGSGIGVVAARGSGQAFCPTSAMFADSGWPLLGLTHAVPATAGQTVRIAFDAPTTVRQADVTGVAPPIIRRPVARLIQDGPTAWLVTLPSAPEPTGFALEF